MRFHCIQVVHPTCTCLVFSMIVKKQCTVKSTTCKFHHTRNHLHHVLLLHVSFITHNHSHFHYSNMYDSSHTKPSAPYTGETNYHVLGVFQEHGIVHRRGEPWKFLKPWQQGTSRVAQVLFAIVSIKYLQSSKLNSFRL